jgi:hypothetical protein
MTDPILAFSWGRHLYIVRAFPKTTDPMKKAAEARPAPEIPNVTDQLDIQLVATTVLKFSTLAIQWLTRDVITTLITFFINKKKNQQISCDLVDYSCADNQGRHCIDWCQRFEGNRCHCRSGSSTCVSQSLQGHWIDQLNSNTGRVPK